jgi:hypothetical protein
MGVRTPLRKTTSLAWFMMDLREMDHHYPAFRAGPLRQARAARKGVTGSLIALSAGR